MMLKRTKLLILGLIAVFVLSTLLPFLSQPSASALSGSQFKAGRIMDDSVFYDYRSMTPTEIQNFINSKEPSCSSGHTCLKSYHMNTTSMPAESGICNNVVAHSNRSAANIIYDVTQACGVSPKVMLVLLQKEQGLIDSTAPTSYMYKFATGFCVYDTTPPPACSDTDGFFRQVYYAARQFKKYRANPTNFSFVAGRSNYIPYSPDSSCGGSNVYIENQATAGLYNYTPYQPNKATLAVGLGVGAHCGAYGNKNFWWYYNIWFGSTYGTPFFRISGSSAIYVLGASSNYYWVPSNAVLSAYGYGTRFGGVGSFSSSYTTGLTYSGALPLVTKFDGGAAVYLADGGGTHSFTSQAQLNNFGYVVGDAANLPGWIYDGLVHSTDMQYVVRRSGSPAIYYVQSGKRSLIINWAAFTTLGSPVYSSQPYVTLTGGFIGSLPVGPPIMPEGSFVKNTSTGGYSIWNGSALQPYSASAAQSSGIPLDYSAPSSELNQLTTSGSTVGKLAKSSGGTLYILDYKKKLTVTSGQLANLGLTSGSFVTTDDTFLSKFSGGSMQSLIKVNGGATVYSIVSGKLYSVFSRQDFDGLGYSWANVINVNSTTGSLFTNDHNNIFTQGRLVRIGSSPTVYLIDGSFGKKTIPNMNVFNNYGYSMGNVVSTSTAGLGGYTTNGNLAQVVKDSSVVYWLVDSGHKHKISGTLLGASYYNVNTGTVLALSDTNMGSIATGADLTRYIQPSGSPAVYKIANGQKDMYTSRSAFENDGGDWGAITQVSNSYAASLPNGANIN